VGSLGWEDVRAALRAHPAVRVKSQAVARAAVAVVLREGAGGLEMLFIRRAEHPQDPWSGHMAFPGGRAEPGDVSLAATAVRETLEETGIDLAREAEFLGPLDEVQAMARLRPVDLAIAPFVYRLHGPGQATLSDEVRSVHWLPLDLLLRPECRSTLEYAHLDAVLRFPCLRVQELEIWGLTYRMFVGLAERMGLPLQAEAPGA